MAHSNDWKERIEAIEQLRRDFADLSNKEQATNDLLSLTKDKAFFVRRDVADALGHVFCYITDKQQAWNDLLALTKDDHNDVQWRATLAIGHAFRYITDKQQAWNDLLTLTKDKDSFVRRFAVSALGPAFQYVTDKEQATKYIFALTKDWDGNVRWGVASALGSAFPHVTDKQQATKNLLLLTKDDDSDVRKGAAFALGSAFVHLTDKEQATNDLLALTKDEDNYVRWGAVSALGSVFQHVTDKEQATKNLLALTKDEDSYVRAYTYHSLGRISILKATDAKEEYFQKELEKALGYFEKSVNEASWYNPADFCLPFYRSFYAITFKKDTSEHEVKKSIKEAKEAVGSSESKENLLEAIENLLNALNEAQKAKGFDEIKGDLNAYMRYCNRAADLLCETEGDAPGATGLIRKGLPIINQHIKDILAEIKKKTDDFCKETRDTPNEDLGSEIHKIGKELSNVRDPIALEKAVENMQMALSILCKRMPEEGGGEACEILAKAKKETYVEDKLNLINMIFPILLTEHRIGQKLDELLLSIKSGISEELVISVGSKLFGTGVEHVIHIPLQEISYPELKEDLEKIKGKNKLVSYPTKLASKIKDYLIRNKKDDLLNKLS